MSKFHQYFNIVVLSVLLSACGGGSDSESSTKSAQNIAPVADAGIDQTIDELAEVTLIGVGTDTDGNITNYNWSQTAGTAIEIISADTSTATFIAPDVTSDEILTFQLTVTDNDGATANDTVDISIARVNQSPIANAGEDAFVFVADNIVLNCDGSSDPDGDVLVYHWQQTKGAPVNLYNDRTCKPIFKVPNDTNNYEFILTVTDEYQGVDTDTITYTANSYTGEVNNWSHNYLATIGSVQEQSSNFITIKDNLAYIGSEYDGWWIADISEPESPTSISKVTSNSKVNEITINDNYAFISMASGIKIFDISIPATPKEVGKIEIEQGVNSVVIKDNIMYAITIDNFFPDDSLDGLLSIDISTITSPKIVASVKTSGQPKAFVIEGNYAYIADGEKGLKVVNIADSESPELLSNLGGLGEVRDIVIKGDNVYTWTKNGMNVVNISKPSEPMLIGGLSFSSNWWLGYRTIQLLGDDLILGTESKISVVDISEPSLPKWKGHIFVVGNSLYVKDDVIYTAGDSGLSVIDSTAIANSDLTSLVPAKATRSIKIDKGYLYATNQTTSYEFFEAIDISSPNTPLFIGDFDFKAYEFDWNQPIDSWDVDGNNVFIVNNALAEDEISWLSTVRMLDITEPSSPELLTTLDLNGDVYSIEVKENIVYAIVQDIAQYPLAEFRIFDLSEPYYPKLLSSIPSSVSNELVIQDDIAYLSGRYLQIIDISNKDLPVLLSQSNEIKGQIKTIEEGIAYIKNDENQLELIDISNPMLPSNIDLKNDIGSFNDITINEKIAYVSTGVFGLKLFDITTPSLPLLDKTIGTNGSVSQSQVDDNYIYIADSEGLITLNTDQMNTTPLIYSVQNFTKVSKSSVLSYSVSWSTDKAVKIKCIISSGSCNTILDKENKTADVEWVTPNIDGNYEIVILGGNTSSQHIIRDRIIIQ